MPLSAKRKVIGQKCSFAAPTAISHITGSRRISILARELTMLRKMYLVSPEYYGKCKVLSQPPTPPPHAAPKQTTKMRETK